MRPRIAANSSPSFRLLAGCVFVTVLGLLLAGCGKKPDAGGAGSPDPHLATNGTVEVTAKLVEIPEGAIFKRDLYDYATILKYQVVKVHRGQVDGDTLYVGHYNPWKPRAEAADKRVPKVGGNVRQFQAGQTHRLALEGAHRGPLHGRHREQILRQDHQHSLLGGVDRYRGVADGLHHPHLSLLLPAAVPGGLFQPAARLAEPLDHRGSYVFYGWWEPWFVCLMMFTTVMDFIWGKVITRPGATAAQRKLAVAACVVTNLSFLGFFKYYMFAAETLNQLLAAVGAEPFRVLTVVLPIGISFYTFHSLTYIIDLYRGHATPAKSFTDFSAFVALFPDLVAGPIIRYKTLAEQLASRSHTLTALRLRGAHLHARLRQEDPAGQPDGAGGRRGVQRGEPAAAGRLGGRAGLRVPDLLRLLRLLGHGGGPGPDARLRVPEELRRALPRREHHRRLAPLAHLALERAARLPLLSAGRQPQRADAHLRQPRRGHAAGRAVARREVELRGLGRVSRPAARLRALARQAEPLRVVPARRCASA